MGSPLRSNDTDSLCWRFNKYFYLCVVYLGHEKKKYEVVLMLPHKYAFKSIRASLAERSKVNLVVAAYCHCVINLNISSKYYDFGFNGYLFPRVSPY